MAGENIVPLTRKGLVSLDVTADKAYSKGDAWEGPALATNVSRVVGFALHAAKKDERLAVGVECDLVEGPADLKAAIKAGTPVECVKGQLGPPPTGNAGQYRQKVARQIGRYAGTVHHDHPAGSKRLQIVWRGLP